MKSIQNRRIILHKKYIHQLKEIIDLSSHQVCAIFASDCANHIMEKVMKEYSVDHRAKDAIFAAHLWISNEINLVEARVLAQKVHLAARTEEKLDLKYFYRACGHAAATIHVKTHAIHASNYAIKSLLSNPNEKIKEIEETERMWQIKHLLDLGLKA